jgi:integrase/recombinase XerD
VEDFARHFHRPPDQLGPEHIREYQAYLFRQRKLAPSSVTQRLAALRFFFIKTLKRSWSVAETPYPKKVQRLPTVLSQEEVSQLINATPTPFYRILLMTLYATGARRNELARLKVSDIDSRRMVVHIQGGKGRKDRDVMLSPVLLEALREYWRRLKPKTWLFPGSRAHTAPCPITSKVISTNVYTRTRCGIALPLICSKRGRTCAPSRCSSVTTIWKRPRFTCTFPTAISAPPPVPWTPWRWRPR